VAGIWVLMLGVNVPILWSYGVTDSVCYEYSEQVARRVFTTFFAFAYVLPLTVIALISVAILRHITRGQRAASMVLQQVRAPPASSSHSPVYS